MPKLRWSFCFGVAAFLLHHEEDRAAFELAEAGDDGWIVAKQPVAVDLLEIGAKALDVVQGVGAFGMARQQEPAAMPDRRSARRFFRRHSLFLGIHHHILSG